MNQESPVVLIRLRDLCKLLGLCKSSIYSLMNPKSKYHDASFPKPVCLVPNGRAVAWALAEVEAWIASRLAAR